MSWLLLQSFTGHRKRKFEIKKNKKNILFSIQYSENIFHEKKFNSICKMDNQIKDDGVICILYKLQFWDLIDLDPSYIGSPGLSFPHVSKYFALNQEWANIFSAGLTNILVYHLGICFWQTNACQSRFLDQLSLQYGKIILRELQIRSSGSALALTPYFYPFFSE